MDAERIDILEKLIFNNNWENRKKILKEIISIGYTLLLKQKLEKIYSERLQISHLLVQKVILHGSSILSLVDGVELPTKTSTRNIQDPFSLNILFRGLLESYLVLNYINFSETEDENEFKFNLWKQYGLRQRGKLIFNEFTKEIKPFAELVLEKENREIENLVGEIYSSNFYLFLDPDKQKTFADQLKKDWKFEFKKSTYERISFQRILDKSGIKKNIFASIYNFLSWSSHSNYISLKQLYETNFNKMESQESINILTESAIFVALACTDLIKKDSDLKIQYLNLNQEEKDLINIYNFSCRDDNYTIEKIRK